MTTTNENDYLILLDFDEASRAWRKNKRKMVGKEGTFEYVCGVIKKNGEICQGVPYTWCKSYVRRFIKKYGFKPMREHSICKQHLKESGKTDFIWKDEDKNKTV